MQMTTDKKNSTPKTSIKAVFWDIDGTLIDSEELHYQVIADWCKGRGYILNKEDNAVLLGKSMAEKWQHLSSIHDFKADAEMFSRECAQMYCDALTTELQRAEPVDIFYQISRKNIPQACVSNGDHVVVVANLKTLNLSQLVKFTISGEDVSNGKPDPEPYLLAADKLGIEPHQCLVVEDSTVGVTSASAAGMIVVAWPEPGTSREGYESADYFATSAADFPWKLFC